jgi:hypothetical protein
MHRPSNTVITAVAIGLEIGFVFFLLWKGVIELKQAIAALTQAVTDNTTLTGQVLVALKNGTNDPADVVTVQNLAASVTKNNSDLSTALNPPVGG